MKLLFASDSFKGSLTAVTICDLLERAAARIFPGAETISVPVADGGEGTVDALLRALGGVRRTTRVAGPLFEGETAVWGLLPDGKTAVLEMAQASGLPLMPPDKRDPRRTTSLGVGQMIADALRQGARSLLLGLGGSATNDGGLGLLTALGAKFTDAQGKAVPPVGGGLAQVAAADFSGLLPALRDTNITVICDVVNPLLGKNGATYVYGPQKGATPEIREELERGMARYAAVVSAAVGRDIASFPARGRQAAWRSFPGGVLKARLRSGIDAVLDAVDFERKLEGVSLVVTGEGCLDGQSVRYGKVPAGVAKRCAARGIPVAALVGGLGAGAEELLDLCEGTVQTIVPGPMSLEQAMTDAPRLYEQAADRLFRALRIGMKLNDDRGGTPR